MNPFHFMKFGEILTKLYKTQLLFKKLWTLLLWIYIFAFDCRDWDTLFILAIYISSTLVLLFSYKKVNLYDVVLVVSDIYSRLHRTGQSLTMHEKYIVDAEIKYLNIVRVHNITLCCFESLIYHL